MTPDRLDFRSVPFRRNIWLRNSETPVNGPSALHGRWLLWTQGKQCRAGSCNRGRIPRITLHLRFSSRLSTGTTPSVSKPRHWPSVHIHDLLRIFRTGVFHSTPQVLHPQVEARLPDRRCGCVYYSVIACRQKRGSGCKQEDKGAHSFILFRYHPPGGERVCASVALGLAYILHAEQNWVDFSDRGRELGQSNACSLADLR